MLEAALLKMPRAAQRSAAGNVFFCSSSSFFFVCCSLLLAPRPVLSITVNTPAEVHASRGDTITLSCTFSSVNTPTSKMMVDWTYRPQTGGTPHTFFHFSSRAFPPQQGQFAGRIGWLGAPARGDASISLANSTLQDNGTYTCSVRNPPDVHGSPTSHTVLTVTPKGVEENYTQNNESAELSGSQRPQTKQTLGFHETFCGNILFCREKFNDLFIFGFVSKKENNKTRSIRFSDVAILLAFIVLPSAAITLFLIGRMICPKRTTKTYTSPIEVTEGEEYGHPVEKVKKASCCDIYLMDSEDEDEYYDPKKRPVDEGYAESQF